MALRCPGLVLFAGCCESAMDIESYTIDIRVSLFAAAAGVCCLAYAIAAGLRRFRPLVLYRLTMAVVWRWYSCLCSASQNTRPKNGPAGDITDGGSNEGLLGGESGAI